MPAYSVLRNWWIFRFSLRPTSRRGLILHEGSRRNPGKTAAESREVKVGCCWGSGGRGGGGDGVAASIITRGIRRRWLMLPRDSWWVILLVVLPRQVVIVTGDPPLLRLRHLVTWNKLTSCSVISKAYTCVSLLVIVNGVYTFSSFTSGPFKYPDPGDLTQKLTFFSIMSKSCT